MLTVPIIKYMEAEKKGEITKVKATLDKWLKFVESLQTKNLSVNACFESMLNLYLALASDTSLKAQVFEEMITYLVKVGQLRQVMIKQVEDVIKLSADWQLSKDERVKLYTHCANALNEEGESTPAFKLYFEAFRMMSVQVKQSNKKVAPTKTDTENVEKMVVNAIKSPTVLSFEELMTLDVVKEIETTSKKLFGFIELLVSKDINQFKTNMKEYKDFMNQAKIDEQSVM